MRLTVSPFCRYSVWRLPHEAGLVARGEMGEPTGKKQLMGRRIAAFVLGLILLPSNLVGTIGLIGNPDCFYGVKFAPSLGDVLWTLLAVFGFVIALSANVQLLLAFRVGRAGLKDNRTSPSGAEGPSLRGARFTLLAVRKGRSNEMWRWPAEGHLVQGRLLSLGLTLVLSGILQMVPYLVFKQGFPNYPGYFITNMLWCTALVVLGLWPSHPASPPTSTS
jgi:hypothetical protein